MPTYAYKCAGCQAAVEFFQSMSEGPKRKCPNCGALKLQRQIGGGAGFIFKGAGFYETDYRSESYKQAEAAERKADDGAQRSDGDARSGSQVPSEAPSEAKSQSKSQSKSDSKSASKPDQTSDKSSSPGSTGDAA